MKDQVLSINQMRHLEELGVDTSKASMGWTYVQRKAYPTMKTDASLIIGVDADEMMEDSEYETVLIPAFTLQDIIELLPEYISYKGNCLRLFIEKDGAGYYDDNPTSFTYAVISNQCHFSEYDKNGQGGEDYRDTITFLQSMYTLLCWCAENGYLKGGKQ